MTEGRGLTAKSRCGIHGDLTGDTGRCPRCDLARDVREVERFARSIARELLTGRDAVAKRQRRRIARALAAGDPRFGAEFDALERALDETRWEAKRLAVLRVADDLAARADRIERP